MMKEPGSPVVMAIKGRTTAGSKKYHCDFGLSKRETGISGRGSPGAAGPRSFLGSLPSGFCSYSLTI